MQKIIENFAKMTSEVDDVHPLLTQLFNKMKAIKKVEYKQGNQENGADFVLIKNDESWGTEEYVGVVVKKGAITKSSHDVIRQIDECIQTARTINGKKSIILDEVWVITIANISISAQEYFSSKYKATKIKFIDNQQLAKLVKDLIPDYFRGIPHHLNNYLTRAKERITILERNAQFSFYAMAGIRLDQDLIPIEKKKYKHSNGVEHRAPSKTTISRIIEKKSAALIEGGMGSGKSSLLRKTAAELLEIESFIESKRIPIYLTFKEFEENHGFSIEKLINSELGNDINNNLEIVLLLDGVDESKHKVDKRLEIVDSIIKQADCLNNVHLIMTARDLDGEEFKTKITSSFRSYRIAPISLKQIISVLEGCCKGVNIKTRMIEDLKKSAIYKALPKTPIAAILLARLINENQNDIPSNLTELYLKFTELSLGRWDISKGLINEKEYSAVDNITKKIAVFFINNNLSQISIEEAKSFFTSHLGERHLGINPDTLFNSTMERSEIFYIDENSGAFGFKHRTFLEFFYAKSMQSINDKTLSENDLDFYWAAINFFWVGLKKDCPEILDQFSKISTSSDKYKLLKIINLSNILLAGYQSPYGNIKSAIEDIFIEAAQLYIDICSGQTESRLGVFSEMHLLAILRYLMADAYGYEFFSEAIDDAIIKISDSKELKINIASTALFLLDTTQVKPVIENLFSSIASKDILDQAPMAVQLAIRHEAKDSKITNSHTKKIDRNIRRIVSNRSIQEKIKTMYELPLDNIFKHKKAATQKPKKLS